MRQNSPCSCKERSEFFTIVSLHRSLRQPWVIFFKVTMHVRQIVVLDNGLCLFIQFFKRTMADGILLSLLDLSCKKLMIDNVRPLGHGSYLLAIEAFLACAFYLHWGCFQTCPYMPDNSSYPCGTIHITRLCM